MTGAASGIGRASALLFAREGARVVAVDRAGADLDAAMAPAGDSVVTVAADAGDEAAVKGVVDRCVRDNGQALAVDGGLSSTHPFVPSRH